MSQKRKKLKTVFTKAKDIHISRPLKSSFKKGKDIQSVRN